jgi:origin recognition complex subunit 4
LTSKNAPIIVRLSGHTQTNDRLAIREMGRQIAEAEGRKAVEGEEDKDEEVGEDEVSHQDSFRHAEPY